MTTLARAAAEPSAVERVRTSVLSPEVAAALSRLSGADLLLTVDLAVRRGPGRVARLRAQHGLHGTRVTAVSTAFCGVVEVAAFDVDDWAAELARAATVPPPAASPAPPAPGLVLPWDLLVGTGAARARGRPEVYDALVARGTQWCRADDALLDPAAAHEQLRRLHGAAGRLRAVAARRSRPRRPRWVSWLLLGEGWYALTPTVVDQRSMVRVEPRQPSDLAREVAVWSGAVGR